MIITSSRSLQIKFIKSRGRMYTSTMQANNALSQMYHRLCSERPLELLSILSKWSTSHVAGMATQNTNYHLISK